MEQGKLRRYTLYAAGEILLVMIGILLALQVNNLNEQRKLRIREKAVLREIGQNIDKNIARLQYILAFDSSLLRNGEQLIAIVKDQKSSYNDSLALKFGLMAAYEPFYAEDGAYENLKQKGLDLIRADTVKQALIELFEKHLPYIEDGIALFETEVATRRYDMSIAYFETGKSMWSLQPNNFETLKNNQEFMNYLTWSVAGKRLGRFAVLSKRSRS